MNTPEQTPQNVIDAYIHALEKRWGLQTIQDMREELGGLFLDRWNEVISTGGCGYNNIKTEDVEKPVKSMPKNRLLRALRIETHEENISLEDILEIVQGCFPEDERLLSATKRDIKTT